MLQEVTQACGVQGSSSSLVPQRPCRPLGPPFEFMRAAKKFGGPRDVVPPIFGRLRPPQPMDQRMTQHSGSFRVFEARRSRAGWGGDGGMLLLHASRGSQPACQPASWEAPPVAAFPTERRHSSDRLWEIPPRIRPNQSASCEWMSQKPILLKL